MRVLRRAVYRRMPWKNGQGVTEEVAVFPTDAGVDAFEWRVSIAHVATDGPFSLFPGIDRTIALLAGAGLILDLPGGRSQHLLPGGAPFAFPGEWDIAGRNVEGPTIDLNVMTRRGRFSHVMTRMTLAAGSGFDAPTAGVVVFEVGADLTIAGHPAALDAYDALELASGETFSVCLDRPAHFLWIGVEPAAAPT